MNIKHEHNYIIQKMISSIIEINVICFFCFLFANCFTKVGTFSAQNFSSCNCVLLDSCENFNRFNSNSSNKTHIKTFIRNTVCSFDGFNIFVCCAGKPKHIRNVKQIPKLDYLDELTGLNCPPSFGGKYNYDEYIKAQKIAPKYYYGPIHFSNRDFNGINKNLHEYPQHDPHHPHAHDIHAPFFPQMDAYHQNHNYFKEKVTINPEERKPNNCGILPPNINGGGGVYPWIARMAYLNTTSRTISYRCMATIISDEHVLTAAHCVDHLVPDLKLIYLRVGDDTNYHDYEILETIVHPNYNEPFFNNDMAILRIANNLQKHGKHFLIHSLVHICLPKNNTMALSGNTGFVAGYSSSGISETKSSTIRYINLPIMNNTECAIRYAKYSENFDTSIVITPTELCAKAPATGDVCEGDSGGPFMQHSKSGRYTLIGVVAFGPKTNCGQSNLPGVYMRVSSYVDWIKSIIQIKL